MKISEIITDKYKLRIPPTVYYELLADVREVEEDQEPISKNDLGVDREQLKNMIRGLTKWYVKRDNAEVGQPNTAVGLLYDDVMFGIDRLPSVTPQEPFKPMVEIDLYSVIKQKYIEREVLDKIRTEIKALSNANPSYWHSGDMVEREEVFDVIDKYKAESEDT